MSNTEYTEIKEQLSRIEHLTLMSTKTVFSIDEAAMFTGLSKTYIYKLTSRNDIPHYKSDGGGKLFFDKKELEDWMKGTKVRTRASIESEAALYNYKQKNS